MNKKNNNTLIIAFILLTLIGCKDKDGYREVTSYVKTNDDLIECISKLDKSKIVYYKSDARLYKPENLPVQIYYIHDVNGKLFSLNNYEIVNYTCSKVEKQ